MNKIDFIKMLDEKICESDHPFWRDVTVQDIDIDDMYGQGRVYITKGWEYPKEFTLGALFYKGSKPWISFTMSEDDMLRKFDIIHGIE